MYIVKSLNELFQLSRKKGKTAINSNMQFKQKWSPIPYLETYICSNEFSNQTPYSKMVKKKKKKNSQRFTFSSFSSRVKIYLTSSLKLSIKSISNFKTITI